MYGFCNNAKPFYGNVKTSAVNAFVTQNVSEIPVTYFGVGDEQRRLDYSCKLRGGYRIRF